MSKVVEIVRLQVEQVFDEFTQHRIVLVQNAQVEYFRYVE